MPTSPRHNLRLHLAILAAHGRALLHRRHLPPGDLIHLDVAERSDRRLLLGRAAIHGPVFKAMAEGRLLVCVVGMELGRRLLREHASALTPVTVQLGSLFAEGFMRQMAGEVHRVYREALVQGIKGLALDRCRGDLDRIASDGLAGFADGTDAEGRDGQGGPHDYLASLSAIATGMLLRVFFGAAPGSAAQDALAAGYRRLGPHGLVWNITEVQVEAFGALSGLLRAEAAEDDTKTDGTAFSSSLLGRISALGAVDDTLLGNLIYMVEMGRYDLRGLFRWISKYAADNPAWIDRIAAAQDSEPSTGPEDPHEDAETLAKAFVLETLRMDQSERLMRTVGRDIVFEGYFIPRGAAVRICLWEAHKGGDAFPDPFAFDPSRFLPSEGASEAFSPFGLDHHHCPFSDIAVTLATVFLRALARGYRVGAVGDGPSVRGAYHWEPAPGFSATLARREGHDPLETFA